MNATTAVIQMPPSATPHLREIERLGFKYQYVPQFDISQLDLKERRVQVREGDHYAPAANVKSYADSMKAGAEFPPIVVSSDYYVVDANTRVEAARRNKLPFFHALVLTTAFKTGNERDKNKFQALAATLNQLGGQRLTTAEAKAAVVHLMRLAWTTTNIQRALGLTPSIVSKIKREQDARQRLENLSVRPPAANHLANAGMPAMLALNDEPYKRLVLLMTDANLSSREVNAMAAELRKAGSDQAAIDLVSKYRAEMEDRIRDNALTGHGRPSAAAKFRQVLGQVLAYEGSEADVVERGKNNHQEHADKLERAVKVLEAVIALQKADLLNGV